MKCEVCGRAVSWRMRGICLACRYKRAKGQARVMKPDPAEGSQRKAGAAKIRIPTCKLPIPKLKPTYPVRIGEVVPATITRSWTENYPDFHERCVRGGKLSVKSKKERKENGGV